MVVPGGMSSNLALMLADMSVEDTSKVLGLGILRLQMDARLDVPTSHCRTYQVAFRSWLFDMGILLPGSQGVVSMQNLRLHLRTVVAHLRALEGSPIHRAPMNQGSYEPSDGVGRCCDVGGCSRGYRQ